jgi:leader peptidase (prepilin peptidase) / N-methyltransferase
VLLPAIVVGFFFRFFNFGACNLFGTCNFEFGISATFLNYILAVLIASGFFLLIYLISKGRWMGFGDVKLAILLGLLLGFPNILAGLFLSFFFGAIIGVTLMFLQKKEIKSEIPFAPFLIGGTCIAMLWGQQLINWYLGAFL